MLKYLKKTLYNPVRSSVKRLKERLYFNGFIQNETYQYYRQPGNSQPGEPSRLLFVGSGKSALEYKQYDLSGFQILTVNNSIKAFEQAVDYYLCSTNFPRENKPAPDRYNTLVGKVQYRYDVLSHAQYHKLGFRPQIGKTIFLDGLYWAMANRFDEIYLLGFDHDYNKKRVAKWQGNYTTDQANLSALFNGEGEEPDAFYGQNTPDPLRHGEGNLITMFEKAKEHARLYGCKIYNLSSRRGIDVFERPAEISHLLKNVSAKEMTTGVLV